MVEHEVHDYPGYRNIQPEWERPSRYISVPDEIATRRAVNRNHYQRHNNHRQDCVTCEQDEIERTHKSLSGEASGAVMVVIREIRNEEQH